MCKRFHAVEQLEKLLILMICNISMKKGNVNLWNLMVHMMILFSGVNVTVFLANSLKIPCNVHMHIAS